MAKMSRDKGARHEREIAKKFSEIFGINIRRTPNLLHRNPDSVVGKRITADLYSPDKETFRFHVECKHRADFKFIQLLVPNSILFRFFASTNEKAENDTKIPLLVFKGGDFPINMVMFKSKQTNIIFDRLPQLINGILISIGCTNLYMSNDDNEMCVITLDAFLSYCKTKYDAIVLQEDDGEQN